MVVSEGMELVIMFFVIMLNLLILVWLQKWSGLTWASSRSQAEVADRRVVATPGQS